MIVSKNINELYKTVLECVLGGHVRKPHGVATRERVDVHMVLKEPRFGPPSTKDEERNSKLFEYFKKELRLYTLGELRAEVWRDKASKFWWDLRNPDGTINSNYGDLTMHKRDAPGVWMMPSDGITQWEWCRTILERDYDSRQAVMHFNRPCHQWFGNRDFPCTMYGVFRIEAGYLNYTVHMRSQDVVKGWPYDVAYFSWQLDEMSRQLGRMKGEFGLFVNSLHVYEKDVPLVERMIGL